MTRSWCLCWIALAACARGSVSATDGQPDDAPCTEQTYFADADGDGHGDPNKSMRACEPPAGMVTSSDDCDDSNPQRFPGNPEVCDALDNDCEVSTIESCPIGCTVVRRPAPDTYRHSYLFCTTTASWTTARTTCVNALYKLAEIDDGAENLFLRTTADNMFGGGDFHIGGTDMAIEDLWVWDGGPQFWQGGSAGTTVGGRFANWVATEPNDSNGNEDCAELKTGGGWNDTNCTTDLQKFICRR